MPIILLNERRTATTRDSKGDRVAVRHRIVDYTGPDFPSVFDYTYTRHRLNGKVVFLFAKGTDRQVGYFTREIRTYYDDGSPIWFVAKTMSANDQTFLAEVSGPRAPTQEDIKEFTPMDTIVLNSEALDDVDGWFNRARIKPGLPCSTAEAKDLVAIAEHGAETKAQRDLVLRFLDSVPRD